MAKSKETLIRFANEEILGNGNLGVVGDLVAADYVLHAGGRDYKGPEFVRRFVRQLRSAIPDLLVVEVRVLVEAGDAITWQRTLRGTHRAALKGIPPSGRKVRWTDMVVTRFRGGKIAEDWAVSDLAAQLMFKLPRLGNHVARTNHAARK